MLYMIDKGNGNTAIENAPGGARVVNTFATLEAAIPVNSAWIRLSGDLRRLQKWIGYIDPSFPEILGLFQIPPDGFVPTMGDAIYDGAWDVFDGLVKSAPGDMIDKFRAMGEPPLLAFYFGVTRKALTERERAMYIQREQTGWKPDGSEPQDGRVKPVRELATGREWAAAADLATELGCHVATLYNHLRRDPRYAQVQGRVFEYAPPRPVPGSIDAMTPDEKEAARARARAAGFEPRF